jgi:uncharacterized protein (TIGR03435 family)
MAFETVSMVASTATPQQRQWLFGSWKVNIIGQPLFDLIENAYELKSGHLIAPDWMRTATYDISGIVPDNSQAYAPQMLRKVLEDKLQLKVHREMRPQPAYILRVAEGGPKLTRATEPGAIDPVTGRPEVSGSPSTIAQLTVGGLDRPIVDETGLQGTYRGPAATMIVRYLDSGRGSSNRSAPDQTEAQKLAQLNQSLEKIGLELRPGTAPVEMLVVDSAEKTPREK